MKSEISNGILTLLLDDPQTNQSFGIHQARTLKQSIESQNYSYVVLRSQSSVFCSGGNLQDYARMNVSSEGLKVNQEIRDILDTFYKLAVPKLAMVTGDCYGGGVELISCCQWIYATPEVLFGLWQRKIGLSFGWGGYERLKTKMSTGSITAWLLEGETKSAERCKQLGLVDHIIAHHKVDDEIENWVRHQSRLYQKSFQPIYENLDLNEVKTFESLWWSEYHKQELKKFVK